jgi:acetyltransferase-like isoleucine patch superfamily enzyme
VSASTRSPFGAVAPYKSAFWRQFILFLYNSLTAATGQKVFLSLRRKCLGALGVSLGNDSVIGPGFFCLVGYHLSLGDRVTIGYNCHIYDWAPVEIGEGTIISNDLKLISATHRSDDFAPIAGPISIGKSCWIGINVTIVGPARIGDNTIIGAGAVVLGDLPADSVCVGVPAKAIKKRTPSSDPR